MKNRKIQDLKVSLKIMDLASNQELAKESKELTLLSFESNLKDDDFLTSCYSNASLISSKHNGSGIPFIEDISSTFINHCLKSAMANAQLFIATPAGTYPFIEINKKPIETKHPGITLQRIEQHLQIHTNHNHALINDRILNWLSEKNMTFTSDGGYLNSPVTEVW